MANINQTNVENGQPSFMEIANLVVTCLTLICNMFIIHKRRYFDMSCRTCSTHYISETGAAEQPNDIEVGLPQDVILTAINSMRIADIAQGQNK